MSTFDATFRAGLPQFIQIRYAWSQENSMLPHDRTLTVAATCVIVAMALGPTLSSQPTSAKAPWSWTIEERITKRVNPAERESRRKGSVASGRPIQSGWSPIDGSVEPELFLPVELVTRLVLKTSAPRERMREQYRAAIVSHGWSYERFWNVLDSAAAPYLSLMQQGALLQRQTQGRADLSQLGPQTCAASIDLLKTAYESFGQQEFDKFLYSDVAPPIRTAIADHADTAHALRNKAKGCR